ncbi:DUF3201 domain-containing protein [Pyrococcus horikoshii]|uniref:DUF3201 domain-containing protein n=2 Tax=Pyrococcus horikoshii TaxID=53953 RepID=O57996_PYRHO|nr:DUF3201 domain-containing protein [Pyrococcus horikoshii]BAA29330.1 168aa long hypothetical protein [Pyrococcus horikoshii OT3]HII61154.1 DUF3201 domain-containing protein [Pyrococcus horikoshii]
MDIREIHNFLNKMWEETFKLREELREELKDFEVEEVGEVFNAYLYVDGRWEEMKYPHPAFTIRPGGEVGATPQGFYFVFAFSKDELTKEFIGRFLRKFKKQSFIYGMKNFLEDFYNPNNPRGYEEVFEKIKNSDEEFINFEVDTSFNREELKRKLREFIELAREFDLL